VARPLALHLVTDRIDSRLPLGSAVAAAVRGGVDAVQVREKGRAAADIWEATAEALEAAAGRARVLVNDRVDVALAAGAAGVHLPARGLPVAVARRLLPRSAGLLVGASVHSVDEARAAVAAGADYVTFGHVFPSGSKPGVPSRGLRELEAVVAAVAAPVFAIGGVDADNAADVAATGCAGVAVIRAVLQAPDPERAAARLRDALDRAPRPAPARRA
jgi:thiamine-phosphate pyrophosphorylase